MPPGEMSCQLEANIKLKLKCWAAAPELSAPLLDVASGPAKYTDGKVGAQMLCITVSLAPVVLQVALSPQLHCVCCCWVLHGLLCCCAGWTLSLAKRHTDEILR